MTPIRLVAIIDSLLLVARTVFAIVWAETVSRIAGPQALRILLQLLTASALAICHGIGGAGSGRPRPFIAVVKDFRQAPPWVSVATRTLFMAAAVDVMYQYIVPAQYRPLQALTISFLLVCFPYALVRSPPMSRDPARY